MTRRCQGESARSDLQATDGLEGRVEELEETRGAKRPRSELEETSSSQQLFHLHMDGITDYKFFILEMKIYILEMEIQSLKSENEILRNLMNLEGSQQPRMDVGGAGQGIIDQQEDADGEEQMRHRGEENAGPNEGLPAMEDKHVISVRPATVRRQNEEADYGDSEDDNTHD